MKKFHFSLDTVLGYKQQVLDSLRSEHAVIIKKVTDQEILIADLTQRHRELNIAFREAEQEGMTIAQAKTYEIGLRVLERQIQIETERLHALEREAEKKRQQVVAARQETASLEKLREKKLDGYRKSVQKQEELFIDELVSASRVTSIQVG